MAKSYKVVRKELEAYSDVLAQKPEIVALNKIDSLSDEEIKKKKKALEKASKQEVHTISGIAQKNVQQVLAQMFKEVKITRDEVAKEQDVQEIDEGWQP